MAAAEASEGSNSRVAGHDAMAHVAGAGMSLPWESRSLGCVTKSEFDVWTWRRWKVLLGVQSTAYAGRSLLAALDLIESLCAAEDQKGIHAAAGRELGAHRGGLGPSSRAATSEGSSSSCSFCAAAAMAKGTLPSNCCVAMAAGCGVHGMLCVCVCVCVCLLCPCVYLMISVCVPSRDKSAPPGLQGHSRFGNLGCMQRG